METNIFTQEGTYETVLMRVFAYEILFKEFGLQGYIVKIEKMSANQLSLPPGSQTNHGQQISYLDSSHLETPNAMINPISSKSSRRKKNNELEIQKKFLNLKFDLGSNKYIGEIINLDNQPPEFLQSIERLNKINENILVTQSEFDDSSRLAVHYQTENNEESFVKYVKNNTSNQDSKILNRLEENMRKNMGVTNLAIGEDNKGEKIDFGQGLRTLKLYMNRLYDPDDLKKEFARDSDEENSEGTPKEGDSKQKEEKSQLANQNSQEDEENEDIDDNSSLFKTRAKFKALIMKQNTKNFFPITRLNLAGLLVLAVLVTLGIVYYAINVQQYSNVKKNYNILNNSNKMMTMSQGILNKVHELMSLNRGIYSKITNPASEVTLKTQIKTYVKNLAAYQTYNQLNTFYLTAAHQTLFQKDSIPMYFQSNSTTNQTNKDTTILFFDLNAATQQIISKTLSIVETNLGSMNEENADIFFLKYNLLNEYANSLLTSTNYYNLELVDLINSLENFVLVILIVSIFICIASLGVLSLFYFYVLVYINQILQVFLEIPINKAKNLFVRCELFLTNLQQGGDDDDLLDNDNLSGLDSDNENEEQGFTTQSAASKKMKVRRKRYKANYKSLKVFILEMLFVIVFIETFFTMYYIQFQNVFENQKQLQEELNNTLLMGPQFSYTNNAIR